MSTRAGTGQSLEYIYIQLVLPGIYTHYYSLSQAIVSITVLMIFNKNTHTCERNTVEIDKKE